MIHWPDLTGAQTETGMICVGQVENRKSRSKFSRTYLVFYDPGSGEEEERLAHTVRWAEHANTHAILARGLSDLMAEKTGHRYDRGTIVPRIFQNRLRLLEVYRGTIFPRYWWNLPYSYSFSHTLSQVIQAEAAMDRVLGKTGRAPEGDPPISRAREWSAEWWNETPPDGDLKTPAP